jgi:hypothetical protein
MAARILIELLLFSTPFMLFGLYLLLRKDAVEDGRKLWPLNSLFLAGLALAALGWIAMIMLDRGEKTECRLPSRMENGQIVRGDIVPCEHDNAHAGEPLTDDPGASGERNDPS